MIEKIKDNKTISVCVYIVAILVICFLKIFFCSVSLSGDVNYCMTADYWNFGKGILKGQTLYVDLIDHKGAYLFWIYSILVSISNGNIAIVAFFEIMCFAIIVFAFYLFCFFVTKQKIKSLKMVTMFCVIQFFLTQNIILLNTESLIIPFYFYVHYVASYKEEIKKQDFFIIGLILGFFITIKYSVIFYFMCPFFLVTFRFLYEKKNFKNYLSLIFSGLLGVCATSLPFVAYLIKTNTLYKYLEIMKMASTIKIASFVGFFLCFIVMFLITIFLYKKKSEWYQHFFCLGCCLCSLICDNLRIYCIGLIVSMIFPCFLHKLEFKKKDIFIIGTMLSCLGIVFFAQQSNKSSTEYISKKYNINNSNVFYFTEDVGYGANKEQLFVEPYQWLPPRMIDNEDFYDYFYELSKNRIINKQFKFIVGYDNLEAKDNKNTKLDDLWRSLEPLIEQYYTKIEEDMLYNRQSIWIAK